MVARSDFDFTRHTIVVADDESAAAALLTDTLRLDGHRVTRVGAEWSAAFDLAVRDCHLFICGSGIGGMRAVTLMHAVRDNVPDLPILCVAAALRWSRPLEDRLPTGVTFLREPFSAESFRVGVRPLLPLSSGGTTLAWPAEAVAPGPGLPHGP